MFRRSIFRWMVVGFTLYFLINTPQPTYAMHIMEGFLPLGWSMFWWALYLPFLVWGVRSIQKMTREHPEAKLLLGLAGAFTFVLSALKIPSVTGSSSHPTGTGLGTVLFGPATMTVLGGIVLLFQAILLAHGGITTLGANAFSLAVVGPFAGYGVYRLATRWGAKPAIAIFLAASLADLTTYVVTATQLALAFPAEHGGVSASFAKFIGIFAVTQIPLAISEGLLTVLVWNWLKMYNPHELAELQLVKRGG